MKKKRIKKKNIRPIGAIMFDIENLLAELHVGHDLQHHEVLYLINGSQIVHFPNHIETYTSDGLHPVLYPIIYRPKTKEKSGNKS